MAAHLQSLNVQKYRPPVMPDCAGCLLVSDGSIEVTVVATAINSTIGLCVLPARCIPVDFILISDDLDSDGGPAIMLTAGVIVSSDLQASTSFLTEDTVAQAGGSSRATAIPDELITPHDADRIIGFVSVCQINNREFTCFEP